ncbi:GIY-YIG nuclease family protein [Candidatus Latescibacterota bacterium]
MLIKESNRSAGVYQIKNTKSGNVFIGSSIDVNARINRHKAEIAFNNENNPGFTKEFSRDLKQFGPESFSFMVLEVLDGEYESDAAIREDLKILEQMWQEKCGPSTSNVLNTPGSPGSMKT